MKAFVIHSTLPASQPSQPSHPHTTQPHCIRMHVATNTSQRLTCLCPWQNMEVKAQLWNDKIDSKVLMSGPYLWVFWMRWLDCITDSMSVNKLWEIVKDRGAWRVAVHGSQRVWLTNKRLSPNSRAQFDSFPCRNIGLYILSTVAEQITPPYCQRCHLFYANVTNLSLMLKVKINNLPLFSKEKKRWFIIKRTQWEV